MFFFDYQPIPHYSIFLKDQSFEIGCQRSAYTLLKRETSEPLNGYEMDKQQGAKVFLVLLILSLILFLRLFWTYISAIVLALLIASIFYPLYFLLKRALRDRERMSSLLLTVLILFILLVPVGWFVGTLSNEAFDLYKRTSNEVTLQHIEDTLKSDPIWADRLRRLTNFTGREVTAQDIEAFVSSVGKRIGLFLYSQISSMASNVFSFLIHFFLMMLTIYYLFREGPRLKDYIIQLLPVPREQLEKVADKFQEMGRAVFVGNGLSGIIQGFMGGMGFFIFDLNSPVLWGFVITFMAFLPIIGASIVFLPATAILLLQGHVGVAMGFLVYNLFYSSIVEYFVKPRLIGQGMKMNALLVFVGIIGGIKLFGILGIIYGPLIITIFLTLAEIYRLEYKEKAA
ncbi:MAG: AI-2E family transporter [Desulfatiglandaceae bacterium]